MSIIPALRPLAAAATVTMAVSLSACGGGGSASSAPEDASSEDFCDAYNSLFEDLIGDMDVEAPEEPSGEQVVEAVKRWAERLSDSGTPQDMPEEAREGFELLVATADELDADDFKSAEDLDKIESQFSEDEKAASTAFDEYAAKSCESPFDLPSDLPTQ